MLDTQDITVLKELFTAQEDRLLGTMEMQEDRLLGKMQVQEERLLVAMKQNNVELKREIRDEIHSLISASETRITMNIADLLDTSVLPQIAELQRDMTVVKTHLQLA